MSQEALAPFSAVHRTMHYSRRAYSDDAYIIHILLRRFLIELTPSFPSLMMSIEPRRRCQRRRAVTHSMHAELLIPFTLHAADDSRY